MSLYKIILENKILEKVQFILIEKQQNYQHYQEKLININI